MVRKERHESMSEGLAIFGKKPSQGSNRALLALQPEDLTRAIEAMMVVMGILAVPMGW